MRNKVFFIVIGVIVLAVGTAIAADLTLMERLGENLFSDKNLSFNGTQSCKSCHHPRAGFADPSNFHNPFKNVVSVGADGFSLGGRNAPTAHIPGSVRYCSKTQKGHGLEECFGMDEPRDIAWAIPLRNKRLVRS